MELFEILMMSLPLLLVGIASVLFLKLGRGGGENENGASEAAAEQVRSPRSPTRCAASRCPYRGARRPRGRGARGGPAETVYCGGAGGGGRRAAPDGQRDEEGAADAAGGAGRWAGGRGGGGG
jgi:hypothetical protein